MSYARTIRVEFNHCDPAGIVFYPRYFEMTNSVCENFFREVVGYSYHAMMEDGIACLRRGSRRIFVRRRGWVMCWTGCWWWSGWAAVPSPCGWRWRAAVSSG